MGVLDVNDGGTLILSWTAGQAIQRGHFLNQSKYFKEILKRFEMENCKEASKPMPTNLIEIK